MDNQTELHIWNHCHHCGASPIGGTRYYCQSCPEGPDNDLCEKCYGLYQKGEVTHPNEDSLGASMNLKEHLFKDYSGKPAHIYKEWLDVKHPVVAAPTIPNRFILRPIFNAGIDAAIGGYSFVTQFNGNSILLTALHVMDEMIKKKHIDCTENNDAYTGKELPAILTGVNLFDLFAANWMTAPLGDAGEMLVLPDARVGGEEPYSYRDIAAFRVSSHDAPQVNPVPLAEKAPAVGDPVWLAARSLEFPKQQAFKAVVVEFTQRSMVFKFDNLREKPKYTSGAPILNEKGEVVGINVGGGQLEGHHLGHANHVESIRNHLKMAL